MSQQLTRARRERLFVTPSFRGLSACPGREAGRSTVSLVVGPLAGAPAHMVAVLEVENTGQDQGPAPNASFYQPGPIS